jgi:hypothetical protein
MIALLKEIKIIKIHNPIGKKIPRKKIRLIFVDNSFI